MKTQQKADTKQNSWFTFKLGDEEFGVHVQNVLNILELTSITKVPKAPEYMTGVINLRGTVLPVIDTRLKLGMTSTEYTDNTCIVVMEIESNGEKIYFGGLVDKVEAVHEISPEEIKTPTDHGNIYNSMFIEGIVERNDRFIMLLSLGKIFKNNELKTLQRKMETEQY
ncbi:MAG: chemotaxis protein CheW [Bacteroidales bacterium]